MKDCLSSYETTLRMIASSITAVMCFATSSQADSFSDRERKMDEAWQQKIAEKDRQWSERVIASNKNFDDRQKRMDAAWNHMIAAEDRRWKELERSILLKWGEYRPSNQKVWVDYDKSRNRVSQIDFESGDVLVEVLVPKGASDLQKSTSIKNAVRLLEQTRDPKGRVVLEGLIPAEEIVYPLEGSALASTPVKGRDGVSREKVSARLSMVPDHVARRAKLFLPKVNEVSSRIGVDPALVLAIMHTESFFNPMARSSAPAFGLMQIVPTAAGKEAYQHVFGVENVPTPEFLYNPDNNILIGVTYLNLLFKVYFQDIDELEKQLDLVICAYNWGPSAVRKNVASKLNVRNTDRKRLRDFLLARAPQETQRYLVNVLARTKLYSSESPKVTE